MTTDPDYLSESFWLSEDAHCLVGRGLPSAPSPLPADLPAGAILFGSSGSSGMEKWIVHTRTSLLASARAVNDHLEANSTDRFGLLLPHFHVGGFGILARAYAARASCLSLDTPWDPHRTHQFLCEQEISLTSLVPTQVYDLVQAHLHAPPTLRAIIVGGGRLEPTLGQAARDLGWPVLQSYGMSEAASQIATAPLSQLVQPYDPDALALLPIWHPSLTQGGQLSISGPALCSAILSDALRPVSPPFQTQDRVSISDNILTFLARQDRTVKVKGELVNLDALEHSLSTALGETLLIVSRPHQRDGQELFFFSTAPLSAQTLAPLLPPYLSQPRCVTIEHFPTSALGKIDRRALIQLV